MKKRNYKCIIKVIAILILMIVAGIFIINQYIFMTRDIRELAPFQLGENDVVESEDKNTIVIISKNPAKPDTATVKIIQKTVFHPRNEENIITINAKYTVIQAIPLFQPRFSNLTTIGLNNQAKTKPIKNGVATLKRVTINFKLPHSLIIKVPKKIIPIIIII